MAQAYQILRQGGLPDDRIVVMMADDLAHNPLNPHPGKIFNKPGGDDVYEGVPKVTQQSAAGCCSPAMQLLAHTQSNIVLMCRTTLGLMSMFRTSYLPS